MVRSILPTIESLVLIRKVKQSPVITVLHIVITILVDSYQRCVQRNPEPKKKEYTLSPRVESKQADACKAATPRVVITAP
jgi:hypothetical protein